MNSCLCDSLSSKLLFHVIFLLFYPPFIPIPAGREIGFLQRNTIEFFCGKRNQFTCFVSSESVSSSSGNTFQNKKQKNSGWHTCSQARVFTCGDVLLKEKKQTKKKQLVLLYWAITCQYASSQRPSVFFWFRASLFFAFILACC